jgi:hypothetical protein
MKSEKEKLAAKTVDQLKAAAKRLGGKLVTPDGKAKTKQQLINTIVMKNRLAGKSMGAKQTGTSNKAKDLQRKAKAPGKRTSAKGKVYTETRKNRTDKPGTMLGNKEYYNLTLSRAFTISVLPKTQTQKARVKIYDGEFNDTKIIPYVADGSGGGITAQGYLESLGIKISARAYSKKTVLLLTKNFLIPITKQ